MRQGTPPVASRDGKFHLTFSADGASVLLQDSAKPKADQKIPVNLMPSESLRAIGFDAQDERFIFVETTSPFVGIWDVNARKALRAFPLDDPFSAEVVAFGPSGTRVVTTGNDGRAIIWDVATGKKIAVRKFGSPVMAVAFNPDETSLAAAVANRLIETVAFVGTGDYRGAPMRGHEGPVNAIAFRADGKLLLSACREDGTARVWNVGTGQELARILSIQEGRDWLVFTPDGRYDGSEGGQHLVAYRTGNGLNVQLAEQLPAAKRLYVPGLLGKIWAAK
jgi:hypothetical protein